MRSERGQSMLEAIIATGIIVTAISSALTLVAGSIKASKDSETSIVAANLAREGIEVVRGIRDSAWLSSEPFAADLAGGDDGTDYTAIAVFDPDQNVWALDYDAAVAVTDEAARVYVRGAADGAAVAGLFMQKVPQPADTSPTQFLRLVTTEPICDDGSGGTTVAGEGTVCAAGPQIGVQVTSTIRWTGGGGRVRTMTARETLYDWR